MRSAQYTSDVQVICVDTVDMAKRIVNGTDKSNASVVATFRDIDAAFQIPAPGEFWTIHRNNTQWVIDRRWDSADEHTDMLAAMQPGDTRLYAPGTLYLQASKVLLNGAAGVSGQVPVVQPNGSLAFGTVASSGSGTVTNNVVLVTADYTVQATDDVILCDTTSVALNITLPSSPTKPVSIKNIGPRLNTVIGSIDNATNFVQNNPMQSNKFVKYGSSWYVI